MVDGVYDKDPHKYPDAKKYDTLTFTKVLEDQLPKIKYARIWTHWVIFQCCFLRQSAFPGSCKPTRPSFPMR